LTKRGSWEENPAEKQAVFGLRAAEFLRNGDWRGEEREKTCSRAIRVGGGP